MTFRILVLCCLMAVFGAASLSAQVKPSERKLRAGLESFYGESFSVDPRVPDIPTVLRKWPGEWHLRHDELRTYFEALATASPRVKLVETGATWEHRPLFLAIVTDPFNHARLDEIRSAHLKLSDDPEARVDLDAQKLVAWLGYSVHGDESSAANASPHVAYRLAADTSEATLKLLKDTVVIIDPCLNPDGLDRFAQWANSRRGQVLVGDPEHREHRQAWPSGRTNHYWFDLNRDWLLAQHPESKARLRWFHAWRPNVLTDHHEMGANSTFFFQPGVPSRTNPLTPPRNQELTALLAEEHGRALDRAGTLYYSKQGFDDFYYGKGSTYPDVNGGVGILFEQASSRGHLQETVNGPLRFPDTVANQVIVSFSTLRGSHARRKELLDWQRTFYREARFAAAADPVKAWVFGKAATRSQALGMARLLERHRIDVRSMKREADTEWLYVVFAKQPQYRLLKSLFERRLTFEDPTFYDVSAWTLPLAFDVPFDEIPEGEGLETLREQCSPDAFRSRVRDGFSDPRPLEKPVVETMFAELRPSLADDYGRGLGSGLPYEASPEDIGLAMDWRDVRAPRILGALLREGLRIRVATAPFRARTDQGERDFPAGSIILPYGIQEGNRTDLARRLETIRERLATKGLLGPELRGIRSGLALKGPDLGSSDFRPLVAPEIALVVEGGVSAYDAGEFWHLLDTRFDLPVTLLPVDRVERARLDRYSHIIMPGGRYSGLDADAAKKLRTWVRAGGVLVATEGACAWAAKEVLELKPKVASKATAAPGAARGPKPAWGERGARRARGLVAGTIYRGLIDATHPLGFGYDDGELFLFKTSATVMPIDADAVRDVCRYPVESPRVAGYASAENDRRIAGTAAVNHHPLGRGAVVRMIDNPCFRAYWWGGFRLVANAIFFGRFADASDEDEDDVDAHGHGHGHGH